MLESKEFSNGEIAKLAQIPEEIIEQIEQEEKSKQTKPKKNVKSLTKQEIKQMRNLVALGVSSIEIARKLNCEMATVRNMKVILGLYSRVQIVSLLKKYDNSQIALISKVDEETISQIRQEQKEQSKLREKSRDIHLREIEPEIRRLFALDISIEEISKRVYHSDSYINRTRDELGVYSRIQIIGLMELDFTDNEIADITNLNVKVIEEFKEIEEKRSQEKEKRKIKNEIEQERIQKGKLERQKKEEEFRILIATGVPHERIRRVFGYASITVVSARKSKGKMLDRNQIVKLMLEGKTNEDIQEVAKIPLDVIANIREKDITQKQMELEAKMIELKDKIKAVDDTTSFEQITYIKRSLQSLLKKYQPFLTIIDYTFITYAYIKIGDPKRAIGIAQKYLNLEDSSNNGIREFVLENVEIATKSSKKIEVIAIPIVTDLKKSRRIEGNEK